MPADDLYLLQFQTSIRHGLVAKLLGWEGNPTMRIILQKLSKNSTNSIEIFCASAAGALYFWKTNNYFLFPLKSSLTPTRTQTHPHNSATKSTWNSPKVSNTTRLIPFSTNESSSLLVVVVAYQSSIISN